MDGVAFRSFQKLALNDEFAKELHKPMTRKLKEEGESDPERGPPAGIAERVVLFVSTMQLLERYSSTRFARQTTKAAKPMANASKVSGPGTEPPFPGLPPPIMPMIQLYQLPMCNVIIEPPFVKSDYCCYGRPAAQLAPLSP